MSNRLVVDVGGGTITEENLSPQEQAEFDALQTVLTSARQADIAARAAIPFDPNDNAIDLVKALNYVQATNTFLALQAPTAADVRDQVRRNSQALRAIIKLLLRGAS